MWTPQESLSCEPPGDFRARLGEIPKQFAEMMVDLRPSPASSYSADYEAGNICAKFYDAPAVPEDDQWKRSAWSLTNPMLRGWLRARGTAPQGLHFRSILDRPGYCGC